MGKQKNALRGHFVQAYEAGEDEPGKDWLELAHQITDIEDATEEEIDDDAFYDGDGTPEATVTSVAGAYDVEGHYDPTDEAQELIAGLKYKVGDGRKVWHRVVASNGKKEWVGRATATEIVAGSGPASEYEAFSCNIRFDTLPEESDLSDGGGSGE